MMLVGLMIGPVPLTGSIGVIKAANKRWIKNRCITYWNGVHKARQARDLMHEPSIERANCILNLRKDTFELLQCF